MNIKEILNRTPYSESKHNRYKRDMKNSKLSQKDRFNARICNDILNIVKNNLTNNKNK